MACPFEEVGRGQAGNLTLPSGMVLPVIAVHCPNGASSRGFASSTERVAVGWCFGCGLAWLVLGFSFWRLNTILCERVALGQAQIKIAILPPFLAIELHFVRKGCNGNPEMAILPQFLAIEPHFVRKGSPSLLQIATLLQFLAIEPHFVRKGCAGRFANRNFTSVFGDRTSFRAKGLRFVPSRWHCPAP